MWLLQSSSFSPGPGPSSPFSSGRLESANELLEANILGINIMAIHANAASDTELCRAQKVFASS